MACRRCRTVTGLGLREVWSEHGYRTAFDSSRMLRSAFSSASVPLRRSILGVRSRRFVTMAATGEASSQPPGSSAILQEFRPCIPELTLSGGRVRLLS